LDENLDIGSSPVSDRQQGEAAIAWQAERFPQVAVSLDPGAAGFLSVTDTWCRAGSVIDGLLDYQTRFATGMDDRTKGAHLISFYSHHLGIAAGAVYLKTGLVADLGPGSLAMRFELCEGNDAHRSGKAPPTDARRFHVRFSRCFHSNNGALLFHDLFVEGLTPVIETLQARTGLSPVAQWRLAADGLAGAFLEIGMALGEEERAMATALAIVKKEGSPLLSSALRYERVDAVCKGTPVERIFRLRSGCCLYYRTEGGDFCDVCVLLDDQTQKGRLRAHIERTGGL